MILNHSGLFSGWTNQQLHMSYMYLIGLSTWNRSMTMTVPVRLEYLEQVNDYDGTCKARVLGTGQ